MVARVCRRIGAVVRDFADAYIGRYITEAEESQHELPAVLQHRDVRSRELIQAGLACVETAGGSCHDLLMVSRIVLNPLPSAASHQTAERERQNQDSHFRNRLTEALLLDNNAVGELARAAGKHEDPTAFCAIGPSICVCVTVISRARLRASRG